MTLPVTFAEAAEAQALIFARQEIEWFNSNPLGIFGVEFLWMDKAENQRFAIHMVKQYASAHPLNTMAIADAARAGWDVAEEALRELIAEYLDRGEQMPTYLQAFTMEIVRNRPDRIPGPKRSAEFFRNVVIATVVGKVCGRFGIKPTRRSRRRASGCSIIAALPDMPVESAVEAIWKKFGRPHIANGFNNLP